MTHQALRSAARRDGAGAIALVATLGIAAVGWVIAVRRMAGMDMGVATALGPFGSFAVLWAAMTAAMMLPAAAPAVLRRARAGIGGVPLFVGSYLAVWTVVGAVAYLLYRPHGTPAAGFVVLAAGLYELTPAKRRCRRHCLQPVRSGLGFASSCLGSSVGLMLVLLALGPMGLTWMTAVSVVVLAQKLWPAKAAVDVPFALLVIAFGALIVLSPGSVPGLVP